jgi:SmpA / OmlA family.
MKQLKKTLKNEEKMKFIIIDGQSDFKILKSAYVLQLILISTMIIFVSGCITLGKDFPESNVSTISIGVTTKNEVRKLFGSPWLSGVQDGKPAWTYGIYDYSLFGEREAKDLVVQFDDRGKVSSFTYSTTDHNE